MRNDFWKNKNVLITGHTGFIGSWLAIWLQKMGAQITGLSIDYGSSKGIYNLTNLSKTIVDWRVDVTDYDTVKKVFNKEDIDIIFHLAAQPSALESLNNPVSTYEVNLMGTLSILEAMRNKKRKMACVFITADTIYDNTDNLWGCREIDALGGDDPFSSSKTCCEVLINSYRQSFFNPLDYKQHLKSIGSARTSYLAGGGDWTTGRIIPDLIRAHETMSSIILKGSSTVVPCIHVLDAVHGYITLAEKLYEDPTSYCEAFNFGPDMQYSYTLKDIADKINELLPTRLDFDIEDFENLSIPKRPLLDITKSNLKLGWHPYLTYGEALALTMDWYLNYKNASVLELCHKEIKWFVEKITPFNE